MLDYLATKNMQGKAFEKVDGLPSTYAFTSPSLQALFLTVGKPHLPPSCFLGHCLMPFWCTKRASSFGFSRTDKA